MPLQIKLEWLIFFIGKMKFLSYTSAMIQKSYLENLYTVITSLQKRGEVVKFLDGILTPKELEEIAVRLQIVKLLKKGVPQREIAEKLEVGIATVTRGSKEIQRGNFKNI